MTRAMDALASQRRRLPMVRIDKGYAFEASDGRRVTLADLFEGRQQLIVYHFMFDPGDPPAGQEGAPYTEGCPGCSFGMDNIPHLSHLHAHGVTFAMVSRAPQQKIKPFQKRMGWTMPWYSSFGSDFNYDFHVTLDGSVAPIVYNYRSREEWASRGEWPAELDGETLERPGRSCFLRVGDTVFHTYSVYARGLETIGGSYYMLDETALGRQEDWEEPKGRAAAVRGAVPDFAA